MASLAAQTIASSAGAALLTYGAKAPGTTDSGDSFADLLAALDPAVDQTAAQSLALAQPVPVMPDGNAAPAPQDGPTDDETASADDAAIPADMALALPVMATPPQISVKTLPPGKAEAPTKDSEVKPVANDNAGTAAPMLAMVPPQANLSALQPPVPNKSGDTGVAPTSNVTAPQGPCLPKNTNAVPTADANVGAPAQQGASPAGTPPATAPQTAANAQTDSDIEETDPDVTATAPQASPEDKPAAAKAAKYGTDFKKMLDGAKPAAGNTATANIQQPQAFTNTDGDAKQGDTKPVDQLPADVRGQPQASAAQQAPTTHSAAQPDLLAANGPAPITANSSGPIAASASSLPAPLPHPAPNLHGLAVDIATRSQSGAKQFDIRLDPPELGRVEVRLSIDATGKAEAHLSADQPQTLDLLQKDAPALTRALREAGLDVNPDGLNFSLRQQGGHAGQEQATAPVRGTRMSFTAPQAETAHTAASTYARNGLGLLDIRV